jgi:uncharacterized membrane protein SpoIIM required for sporulation
MPNERGNPLRLHWIWTLVVEAAFFVVTLATAAGVAADTAALRGSALRPFLRQLGRTFSPLASVHPWYRLAAAIFLHNARPFVAFALAALLVVLLARSALNRVAAFRLVLEAAAAVLFWFGNVMAAGVVVGAVAHTQHLAPLRVWATLLPHGIFELFAFSWVMALPLHMAWAWMDSRDARSAVAAIRTALWPGAPAALAVLALAGLLEASVSPRIMHVLVPTAGPTLPSSTNP